MRRRLSSQQRQENISRMQFREFLEQHEWVAGDVSPDLGEDILVRIYEDGVSTGLSFYVQLKSVDAIGRHVLSTGEISYSFEVKDLEHWEAQAITVILGIWDIQQERGWWIEINQAIQFLNDNTPVWRSQKTAAVHIPVRNEFTVDSLDNLRYLLANRYYPIVAKGKELTGQARFSFPQTPEGMAKLAELQRFLAAGDPVELDGKYIEAFDFPDWWTRLYGRLNPANMQLKISSSSPSSPQPARIDFVSEVMKQEISYVELWNIRHGEEEITISNEPQNIPLKFSMVINRISKQRRITLSISLSNLNCQEARKYLRIQQVLSLGGNITVTLHRTGMIMDTPISTGVFPAPDSVVVELVEKMCFIQENMGVELCLGEGGTFTYTDLEAADELISIIHTGQYHQSNAGLSISVAKSGIAGLLAIHEEDRPVYLQITVPESYVEILSQQIDLGPMVQTVKGYWKTPLSEVLTWYEQAQDDELMVVQLVNAEITEVFDNWKH